MKQLSGHAEGACRAGVPVAAELLRAVDGYPSWHPDVVRRVSVLQRDVAGYPRTVEAAVRIGVGPVVHDLDLTLAVSAGVSDANPPASRWVKLARLPNDPEDEEAFVALWRLDPEHGAGTTLSLEVEACIDIPRLLPIGDAADRLAKRFVDSASAALNQRCSAG